MWSAWETKHNTCNFFGLTHSWLNRVTVDLFLECPWPTCPCVTFWTPLEDNAPEPFCGSLNIPESFRLFGVGLDASLLSFVSPTLFPGLQTHLSFLLRDFFCLLFLSVDSPSSLDLWFKCGLLLPHPICRHMGISHWWVFIHWVLAINCHVSTTRLSSSLHNPIASLYNRIQHGITKNSPLLSSLSSWIHIIAQYPLPDSRLPVTKTDPLCPKV